MTELILMRHGATQANSTGIYCGRTDIPLTNAGIEGASQTASRLAEFAPAFVYASDLLRARQTAQIAAPDLQPVLSKDLREIDFGDFEGLDAEQISQRMPDAWQAYLGDYMNFKFPGGDDVNSYLTRSALAVHNIVSKHEGDRILIVSHKGLIISALSWYLHQDHAHIFRYDIRPAGYARLHIYDDMAVLHQLL